MTYAEEARSRQAAAGRANELVGASFKRALRDEYRPRLSPGPGLRVRLARFTSREASVLYPAGFTTPTRADGVLIGVDVTAGDAPFFDNPWSNYLAGELTDTNAAIFGAVGVGKSATAKAMLARHVAVFGPQRRFVMVVSPKAGEYDRLATELDLQVISLSPGGQARLNPMDIAGGGDDHVMVRQQLLRELIERINRQPLTPVAAALLDDTIVTLSESGRPFTLADVHAHLTTPSPTFTARLGLDERTMVEDTIAVRAALERVVHGSLRGLFDGPSTVRIDWHTSNGVVFDLAPVSGTDAFELVLLATSVWLREAWKQRRRQGGVGIQLLDESWEFMVAAGSYLRADLKKSRNTGLSTWFIAHRDRDLDAAADDGTASAKVARSLFDDVSTRLVFRDSPSVADHYQQLLGLTDQQAGWIPQLVKGRCLWLRPNSTRVVQVALSDRERWLFDTDAAMRQAQ